jgi:hypothetical protein
MAHCASLGVYRKCTFVPGLGRCKKGVHDMAEYGTRQVTKRGVACRKCRLSRVRIWYWAKQFEMFDWSRHLKRNGLVPSSPVRESGSEAAG